MTDVTDADRNFFVRNSMLSEVQQARVWTGEEDSHPFMQDIARHRASSIAPYVEALREARTELQHFCYSLRAGLYPSEFDNTRKAIAQIDALLGEG